MEGRNGFSGSRHPRPRPNVRKTPRRSDVLIMKPQESGEAHDKVSTLWLSVHDIQRRGACTGRGVHGAAAAVN